MYNTIYKIIIIIITYILFGCNKLSPQQFVDYVNDKTNGFVKEEKCNNYSFKLQYLPPDYIALQYVMFGIDPDFEKCRKQANSSINFKLTICNEDTSIVQLHKDSIFNNSSTAIIDRVIMISNGDTINSSIDHKENNAKIKPCENILYAFENKKNIKPEKIIVYASRYAKNPIVFKINKIKQIKIPDIKL